MNQNNETELDNEYKRYLQILRRHLSQIPNQDVINICNAWIKKLSDCKNEKSLRNKYVFVLCHQLARGILDEPFLKFPMTNELPPLQDDESVDSSGTEVECLVIESGNVNMKSDHDTLTSQIVMCKSSDDVNKSKENSYSFCDSQMSQEGIFLDKNCKPIIQSYPSLREDAMKYRDDDENYYLRANKLIMNLREIKEQNQFLRNELILLKEEAKRKRDIDESFDDSVLKVDNSTIRYDSNHDSPSTCKTLMYKLQEIQTSRNNLIETVGSLQEKLDNFIVMKMHEIEDIHAQHKLEIIKLKTDIREEEQTNYKNKLETLKKDYEKMILDMQHVSRQEIETQYKNNEKVIIEKENLLRIKDVEISQLKCQLEELKNHRFSVLNKFTDSSNENSAEGVKIQSRDLERLLIKMERIKNKCVKVYETKIATLQREKHLAECSLQLQLVKQRAQVVDELTDENQVGLATALDSLENKYKEIVANVQATAFQRRIQDQIALESLIQAICGVTNESQYANSTKENTGQHSGQSIRNQTKGKNMRRDKEIGTLRNSNTVDNVQNKSFGEHSIVTGYCLDSDKLQELFEKVHIPQRDVGDLQK